MIAEAQPEAHARGGHQGPASPRPPSHRQLPSSTGCAHCFKASAHGDPEAPHQASEFLVQILPTKGDTVMTIVTSIYEAAHGPSLDPARIVSGAS